MGIKFAAAFAACAGLAWPISASAALVTLNQTIDVNTLTQPNGSEYDFLPSAFAPFSLDLAEGDILKWTISFLPGQSLTIPNISSITPILFPTTYTGLIDSFTGSGIGQQAITFFDSAGHEIGWVPGDGNLSNEVVGLFQPRLYGNLEPSITFSSVEARLKITNYETPGVTTVNFSSATLFATQPSLHPGETPFPPTRTLPSSKPAFLFPELAPPPPPVNPIPEPATWIMMITGFGLIGLGLRRRRATSNIPPPEAIPA